MAYAFDLINTVIHEWHLSFTYPLSFDPPCGAGADDVILISWSKLPDRSSPYTRALPPYTPTYSEHALPGLVSLGFCF